MNIRQYKERLAKHDWHYAQTHDSRVYDRGLVEEKALKSMCHGKTTYQKAYDIEFRKHFKYQQ